MKASSHEHHCKICLTFSNLRDGLASGVRLLTQFHAYWHILAGFAAYGHILFLLHLRSHYHGRKVSLLPRWYGVGIELEKSEEKLKPTAINGLVREDSHQCLHNGKVD